MGIVNLTSLGTVKVTCMKAALSKSASRAIITVFQRDFNVHAMKKFPMTIMCAVTTIYLLSLTSGGQITYRMPSKNSLALHVFEAEFTYVYFT